jgi:uncharacterized protein (DUF1697 family)
MPVLIALLRGVNVGGHHKIKMDVLRELCAAAKLDCAQTYLQSGNVVFRTKSRSGAELAGLLETAIERKIGFRPSVVLRNVSELRRAIANNPFAKRPGLEPGKLAVLFLAREVDAAACKALLEMDIAPEELRVHGQEIYIYFPNGQGRPKLSWARVDKILGRPYTGRNWNTVTKLLELAEGLEESSAEKLKAQS